MYKFTFDQQKNRRANEMYNLMEPICKAHKISPVQCLAQWTLETGWGSSNGNKTAQAYFILFGIKATGPKNQYWSGTRVLLDTTEYINGKKTAVKDWFRGYDTIEDSVGDYVRLIASKYPTLEALAKYATDPDYIEKVKAIMKQIQRGLDNATK